MKYLKFLDDIPDEQARKVAHDQLDQMTHFAEHDACRRVGLLGYFGETWPLENCGGCDHCLEPREKWDATIDVQKLLSCILRIRQAGGFSVGLNHVSEVLTGGLSEKIKRWKHDELKTHGIGKDQPRPYWVDLGRQLLRQGLLVASADQFPTVSVSQKGIDVVKSRSQVLLTRSISAPRPQSAVRAGDLPCDTGLFDELRNLRKRLADERNVPPYVVFSDVTLRYLAREYPVNDSALVQIPGVGEKKREDFGGPFLKAIRDWVAGNPKQQFEAIANIATSQPRKIKSEDGLSDSAMETLNLWRKGKNVREISVIRGFAETTIEGHLAQAIEFGEVLDPRAFYTVAEELEMKAALDGYEELSLKPVYDQLEGRISYGKLKLYRATLGVSAGAAPA